MSGNNNQILGGGNVLKLTNAAGALIALANLVSIKPPTEVVETIETTHQGSGGIKEYIAGLTEPGDISGTVHYLAGSPTDLLLREHRASKECRAFEITVPTKDAAGEPKVVTVTGMVVITNYEPDDSPIGGVRVATFTGKVSGGTTETPQADP